MWTAIGIVLFVLGLLFSIAWHELGHLTFAKLFNVRTTQYMVGFGKTIWSRAARRDRVRHQGRAAGRLHPDGRHGAAGPKTGRQRITTTSAGPMGMFRQIVEDTRAGDRAQVLTTDDGRQFYQLHPFKRIVIMVAGPVMNLILAVGIFAVIMVGIGVPMPNTTVATVSACVVPASASAAEQAKTECAKSDWTPARTAGLQAGDTDHVVQRHADQPWDQLTTLIRAAAGTTVTLTVDRNGTELTKQVPIVRTERPVTDATGKQIGTAPAGFLGVSAAAGVRHPADRHRDRAHRPVHRHCRARGRHHPGPHPGAVGSDLQRSAARSGLAGRHRRRGPDLR